MSTSHAATTAAASGQPPAPPRTPPPAPPGGEVVERTLAAFAAGDVEGVVRCFSPEVVVHQAACLPYGGTHHGHEQFLAMLGGLGAAYDVQMSSHTLTGAGDVVVLRMELTFTARTTGRSTQQPTVELYTVREGLITGVDVFYKDTRAVLDLLHT